MFLSEPRAMIGPAPRCPEGTVTQKRLEIVVSGRVQGVWFRASTREEALRLGLRGWVRNLPDGRVEAVFEGAVPALEQMLAWCKTGPRGARVERADARWAEPADDLDGFSVRP